MSATPRPPPAGQPGQPGRPRAGEELRRPPPAPAERPPGLTSLERLYVYWIISSLLLLFLAVVPLLFLRAEVRRQATRLAELQARVSQLEQEQQGEQERERAAPRSAPAAEPSRAAPAPPPDARPAMQQPGSPDGPAAGAPATQARTTPAQEPARPTRHRQVADLLARALSGGGPADWELADRTVAEELLSLASGYSPASLPAGLWEQVAVVARLMNRASAADGFLRRAAANGHVARDYEEHAARLALSRGAAAEARATLEALRAGLSADRDAAQYMRVGVLLLAARLAAGDLSAADELLPQLEPSAELTPGDWLLAARSCLTLERFDQLDRWLMARPAAGLDEQAHDWLRATALIHAGRAVEGLAVLDFLEAHGGAGAEHSWELQLWRGRALLEAGDFTAARAALDEAVALAPDLPQAYYWRGALETRLDELDAARLFLRNALTNEPNHVPALELLGLLEINGRNPAGALEPLQRAVALHPRRATSHFLYALARAKLGRDEEAAASLHTALSLAPELLAEALQSDLLAPLLPAEAVAPVADEPGETATATPEDTPKALPEQPAAP